MTLEEAVGKDFFELNYPADLAARLQRQIQQVIKSGLALVDETPYTSPAGVSGLLPIHLLSSYQCWHLVEAVAGSTRDITAQKHVEEELRLSVIDRERLLDAESASPVPMLNLQARQRIDSLAVLSHELRTPLTPVVMSIGAIELNQALPENVREAANMIRRNVELEMALIDDLLDISRITSGKLQLHSEPLDINDLVGHVCEMCRSTIREKNVRLHRDLDENAGIVAGDSARLHQVFWNLLSNAAKFTPAHGQIDITTKAVSDSLVRITVSDTGMGIPAEVLPNIFKAFEQGDPRITRQFGGLGLGLAISKRLIEAHQGSIVVETGGLEQGSTFIVELPSTPRGTRLNVPAAVAPPDNVDAVPLRLLIVEDHADTARVLSMLLKAAGHSVQTAGTAALALKLASQHPFDIVVSDVGLPDMTGYDLMHQIKQRYGLNGICMSGYGMEEDRQKSADAGFAEHLVKPVSFSLLEQSIRRVAEMASRK